MTKLGLGELRTRHAKIVFAGVESSFADGVFEARFDFRLDPDIEFHPTLRFPGVDEARLRKLDPALIRAWLVRIGMVEMLSYWKAACPREIVIGAGYLDPGELPFWRKLLVNGMSEFFYVNGIDGWQENFVRFVVDAPHESYAVDVQQKADRYLTPVGGGKDSAVTVELLKKANLDQSLFMLNGIIAAKRTGEISGVAKTVEAERIIDPKLIELNAAGYLNGHTPFSAMLAFVSTFAAYLHDYRHVALSNEWSANEANIVMGGNAINHQYSKSFEFEKDFREYLNARLSASVEYFSALRPLHELQIARIFCRHEKYFPVFSSCNRKIKTGEWCASCAKCLFAAIMLSAFISRESVKGVFRKDILDDESLLPILNELTGLAELKSLDCVGTRDESKAALRLAIELNGKGPLPKLLAYAAGHIVADREAARALAERVLAGYEDASFLPKTINTELKEESHA